MSKLERILNLGLAAFMVYLSILVFSSPLFGYMLILCVIQVALLLRGIGNLVYYFRMTRYMVGGKLLFYKGVLLIDMGIFSSMLLMVPTYYILLYMLAGILIAGAVTLLHAFESRQYGSRQWKSRMVIGLIHVAACGIGLVYIRNLSLLMWIYGLDILVMALERVLTAFKRTAVIYVQ